MPPAASPAATDTASGNDGGVAIGYTSMVLGPNDYEGKPTAILTYTVTNNTDKTYDMLTELEVQAYQNGTSLDNFPIYTTDPKGYDSNSSHQKIQPGATATVTQAFVVSDPAATVKVEATPLFDFDNEAQPVSQEFKLQ